MKNRDKKILFLELGVGTMTPMFIKEPFWEMTYSLPNASSSTCNHFGALISFVISGFFNFIMLCFSLKLPVR